MRILSEELLKTIRSTHLLSLAILGTALVLLFAPFEIGYRRALSEAVILKDLPLEEYEHYAGGFIGANILLPHSEEMIPRDWPHEIAAFLDGVTGWNVAPDSSPRWDVVPILDYPSAPTEGTLQDWLKWITSKAPAHYWVPDWKKAGTSISRNPLPQPPKLKFFALRASDWRRTPGEYTFRAFFEEHRLRPLPRLDVGLAGREAARHLSPLETGWWSAVMLIPSRDLWHSDIARALQDSGRFFVEGDVPSLESRPVATEPNGSVNSWLRRSDRWALLTESTGLGETVLPGLHQHWSELAYKSLNESLAFMEAQQHAIRDVDLFGLSIPGTLCIVAVPIALMLCNLYLLLHLRSALRTPVTSGASTEGFPWIGLYNDRLAAFTTILSLTIIPTILLVSLLLRYESRAGIKSTLAAAIFSAVAVVLGWLNWVSTKTLRLDGVKQS
jgi:hypothetical protein